MFPRAVDYGRASQAIDPFQHIIRLPGGDIIQIQCNQVPAFHLAGFTTVI